MSFEGDQLFHLIVADQGVPFLAKQTLAKQTLAKQTVAKQTVMLVSGQGKRWSSRIVTP